MSLSVITCDVAAHADTTRELARAAAKIVQLEARVVVLTNALADIAAAECDFDERPLATSRCACCLHDHMIAQTALDGVK